MQMLFNIVLAVQILSALAMIGLVLIQHGKGADMGASFGSGASGSLFGATGSANFLSRSTAVCASLFFIATLVMAYQATNRIGAGTEGGSVLERAATAASAPPASASAPVLGGSAPAASAASAPTPAASSTPTIPAK